ncbi:type II toxin-antitoxin system HicA family toxin [Campylobacter sp. JMF_01 NE2]|uniref:type II toxin-antitoxin system HicA family toxin n=1 Tax=unclassified Campylobacter TaxID=2593542 RepID=UPI0022EA021D|nr:MULTISPECIES: type II toxin-antitoxin system HicA family toxin [unclassified Campylobacter]MDA3053191.1 type II toxin-antitoxin system HicA family toxin [Campylobacter sp. JMF_03 NE3]MDA3067626.1 type II toxin-antitoxin system HicA family toxin [Campylobacter sp. JMF_01 NE2]
MSKFEKLIKKLETNPKDVTFDDLDKILILLGYERKNTGGSHFVYRKKNAQTYTLPRQKPMLVCYVKDVLDIYKDLTGE